jgi:hypothetical protein
VRKDEILDRLAEASNVAQFIAYQPEPQPMQTYARVLGMAPNHRFASLEDGIAILLASSGERSLNVRSYTPDDPQSRPFKYGLKSVDSVVAKVKEFSAQGLYTIVNETIDIHDGGVSGVIHGGLLEFLPDALPRDVDKKAFLSLPRALGIDLLECVYGFRPEIDLSLSERYEFSIHPKPRGWRHGHTIGWELQHTVQPTGDASVNWPNDFSRMIGDKAFGLLIAHLSGLPVPRTTVVPRRIAPFSFGQPTGSFEIWFRTCPKEQQPGRFITTNGWSDPFDAVAREDREAKDIASVLAQHNVRSKWSGSSLVQSDGSISVEGRAGSGETFMQGTAPPEALPAAIIHDVLAIHAKMQRFGAIRFEWVHDGDRVWIVQFHRGISISRGLVIVDGNPVQWLPFNPDDGLDVLRTTLAILPTGAGIEVIKPVGLTSHVADVLRRANVPSRINA